MQRVETLHVYLKLSSPLHFLSRRGGRVVEGTGLENRQGVKALEGSNPSLSANIMSRAHARLLILQESY